MGQVSIYAQEVAMTRTRVLPVMLIMLMLMMFASIATAQEPTPDATATLAPVLDAIAEPPADEPAVTIVNEWLALVAIAFFALLGVAFIFVGNSVPNGTAQQFTQIIAEALLDQAETLSRQTITQIDDELVEAIRQRLLQASSPTADALADSQNGRWQKPSDNASV